jgi:L-threonylcarbamoyladenylate synthase
MVAETRSNVARCLAKKYWPGPLTLVLPRLEGLSDLVTGGRDTVAVRSPAHWAPQVLIGKLGRPLTGTSANLSGGPDAHSLDQVRRILGNSVDYIISGGPAPVGAASTIVGIAGGPPYLIREGEIPFPEILNSC